jgi:hypothetical protein
MKKVQRVWPDVAKDLSEHLQRCELNNIELSKASGVNYHAIRRLRKNGVHNQSGNAKKLCIFFNISLDRGEKLQPDEFSKLVSELEAAWDGTEPHAKLLTKLIRSTKSFRVEGRKEV